jgi:ABC-type oligopeptide transport system substrate-binding subunit
MSSHARSRLSPLLVTVLATLAVVAFVTLVDPPAVEAQRKKILNVAAKEPDTLDPHASILGQTQAIVRFMYRGLTRFAIRDGKVTTAEVDPDLQAQERRAVPQGLR